MESSKATTTMKDEIEEVIKRRFAEKLKLGAKLGNVQRIKMQTEVIKVLNEIFKPTFVCEILFDLQIVPIKQLQVSELIPWKCNYPADLTVKSITKPNGTNEEKRCKRLLGKDMVFFCSYPKHQFYAKSLKLPVTVQDAKKQGIQNLGPKPPNPKQKPRQKLTTKGKKKSNGEKVEQKEESDVESDVEMMTESITESIAESEERDAFDTFDTIDSIFDCSHVSLLTEEKCRNEGTHEDPFDTCVRFCDEHVCVSAELLDAVEDMEDNDDLLQGLLSIDRLDQEIQDVLVLSCNVDDDDDNQALIRTLCKERYALGNNYNIGIDSKLMKYLEV